MADAVVIGYGNPLRGDDALGWIAVEELERTPLRGVETLAVHQLTPELAETISRARLVVFIDAAVDLRPGELASRELVPRAARPGAFTHEFTPETLLAMAADLYNARPHGFLISLGVGSTELGNGLSAELRSGMPALLKQVRIWLEQAQAGPAGIQAANVLRSHEEYQ
jgi:hydrogenase maturation protease